MHRGAEPSLTEALEAVDRGFTVCGLCRKIKTWLSVAKATALGLSRRNNFMVPKAHVHAFS
jgi:hypothetical protein